MAEKTRKIHMDVLRILAAFLVIFNHTSGFAYYINHTNNSYKLLLSMGLSAFTKINVPLFFMLSGALLLGREEPYSVLLKKRVGRYALVLLGASACAYCVLFWDILSVPHFLYHFLSCRIIHPYWFLYAYLAFLLALPLLRKIARSLNGQDILLLLLLRAVFSTGMTIWQYIAQYNEWSFTSIYGSFTLPFATTDILFYPLLGYYLEHGVKTECLRNRQLAMLWGCLFGSIAASVGLTWHQGTVSGRFTEDYLTLLTYVTAASVYLLGKVILNRQGRFAKLIKPLGKFAGLTLGIYLMDPLLLAFFGVKFTALAGESLLVVPLSLVYCCISMAVCGGVTWGLKKIPGVRNLL